MGVMKENRGMQEVGGWEKEKSGERKKGEKRWKGRRIKSNVGSKALMKEEEMG